MEKYCTASLAADDSMTHAHCILDTKGYKYTISICNVHYFSTATMVARTRLNVTLNVHWLSCSETEYVYCAVRIYYEISFGLILLLKSLFSFDLHRNTVLPLAVYFRIKISNDMFGRAAISMWRCVWALASFCCLPPPPEAPPFCVSLLCICRLVFCLPREPKPPSIVSVVW